MKQIDLKEFAAQPDRYVHEGDALQVQHEGKTIGYYLPAPPASAEARQRAVSEWGRVVEDMRATAGMTEDEFAGLFDLTQPFPNDLGSAKPAAHAPGR